MLETLPFRRNSDDFVFDNQILAQAVWWGFPIGEISCPARHFPEASSIGFGRSVRYGAGVLETALRFRLRRWGLGRCAIFKPASAADRRAEPRRASTHEGRRHG